MKNNKKELTDETLKTIYDYIKLGLDFGDAVVLAGFSLEESGKLSERIKNPKSGFEKEIRNSVYRSRINFEAVLLQNILKDDGTTGAKWLLERCFFKKYNLKKIKEQDGEEPLLITEGDFYEN